MMETCRLLAWILYWTTYIGQTMAMKCGDTYCNEYEMGYCCSEEDEDEESAGDCCCYGIRPTEYTIECVQLPSFSTRAVLKILLVTFGVIAGVIVIICCIVRGRRARVTDPQQTAEQQMSYS